MSTIRVEILSNGLPVLLMGRITPSQSKIYGAVHTPKGEWAYPAFYPYHQKVLEDIRKVMPAVSLPKSVLEHFSNEDLVPQKMLSENVDGYTPVTSFYPHQKTAFCHALWNMRYGLFLGRGLGKTKIVIDLVRHLKTKSKKFMCLVIALKVNIYTWRDEALVHSGGDVRAEPLVATGPKKRAQKLEEILKDPPDILVITYDTARVAGDLVYAKVPYTMLVADESHRLRGHNSKQTKAVHDLARKASRRLILTGTASLGDPRHLWGQLRLLGKFIVPNFWKFKGRYTIPSRYHEHAISGFKNMHLLSKQVSTLALSLEAEDCLELPPRSFEHISIAPTPSLRKAYNTVVKGAPLVVKDSEGESHTVNVSEKIVALSKLAQLSSGFLYLSKKDPTICDGCPHLKACVRDDIVPYTSECKVVSKDPGNSLVTFSGKNPVVQAVSELLEGHLADGRKVIIWAKHVAMLDMLHKMAEDALKSEGLIAVRYDSTTKDLKATENQFNLDPKTRVLIGQISMGIGVTFKAPAMIYAELDWRLDYWLQSLDRNFGIRAKGFKQLLVQTVAIEGSVMDATRRLLTSKIDVAAMVTRTPECVSCDRSIECLSRGVKPYEPLCKFSKETKKTTIKTPTI